jgi:hypothetical protein
MEWHGENTTLKKQVELNFKQQSRLLREGSNVSPSEGQISFEHPYSSSLIPKLLV